MSRTFSLLRLRATPIQRSPLTTRIASIRSFSNGTTLLARKDTQDKDSMKIEPNEISKSGSDSAAASIEDTAFSADKTRPEEQHASAEEESYEGNPLDVSPANHEVSEPRGQTEGGSQGSSAQSGKGPSDRARSSGKGGQNKNGQ